MPANLSAEEILKEEEERYARFRTGALKPPRDSVARVSSDVRTNIRYAILRYFWINPRDHKLPFDSAPEKFAPAIAKILGRNLDNKSRARLDAFAKGETGPFLILKNVLSVPALFPKTEYRFRELAGDWDAPVVKHCQRQMRTIDCTLAGLLHLLGSTPSHRFAQIHRAGMT